MPGHDIPEPYKWDESFQVFYAQLDEEHKGLFQGIFACCGANTAENLKSLADKVKAHFTYEEGEMDKANYADVAPHKQAHAAFVAKLEGLSAPLDDASIKFAKEWLVNHIKDTDFKYKGKLA